MAPSVYDLLLIEQDPEVVRQVRGIANKQGWSCHEVRTGQEAFGLLDKGTYRAVVCALRLSDLNGLQILEWLKTHSAPPEVIILMGENDLEFAVKALKLGAFDCLSQPLHLIARLAHCISHAIERYNLIHKVQSFEESPHSEPNNFNRLLGKSPKMQALFEFLQNIASTDTNILIQGESGTGKELVAQIMHRNGPKRDKPFVVINCVTMAETLLESELFGYVKGAFTGAMGDKKGLFEVADSGTVFLDEIGDMPLSTQVKLLRVLQEGEIRPLGSVETKKIDVRIIAATNRDLTRLIREGTFREDLFYRLNVIHIDIPPLRDRREDVSQLAYHFMKKYSEKTNRVVTKISLDALQTLQNYDWPGNVRELENTIERAVVLTTDDCIRARNLPSKLLSHSFYKKPAQDDDLAVFNYKDAKKRALNVFNRSYIMALLERTKGNISQAAEYAGMDRSNFKKILKKYQIEYLDVRS